MLFNHVESTQECTLNMGRMRFNEYLFPLLRRYGNNFTTTHGARLSIEEPASVEELLCSKCRCFLFDMHHGYPLLTALTFITDYPVARQRIEHAR